VAQRARRGQGPGVRIAGLAAAHARDDVTRIARR